MRDKAVLECFGNHSDFFWGNGCGLLR
jgi:hypothetical protein